MTQKLIVLVIVLLALLITLFLFDRDQADKEIGAPTTPGITDTENKPAARQQQPLPKPEQRVFFPDDLTSQRAAERLIATGAMSEDDVARLAAVSVVLTELEDCEFATPLESLFCVTDPQAHPYYTYDVEALESMAYADPVAAYIYADRVGDFEKKLTYNLRSTVLSGKVGPLLRVRTITLMYVFTTYGKIVDGKYDVDDIPHMYRRAIEAGDRSTAAALAIDEYARSTGIPNDLYPELPDVMEYASAEAVEHFEHYKAFFQQEAGRIRGEVGSGNADL